MLISGGLHLDQPQSLPTWLVAWPYGHRISGVLGVHDVLVDIMTDPFNVTPIPQQGPEPMKNLTTEQAQALLAFCECFDLYTTGAWAQVEKGMRADFGVEDPETAIEDAKEALQQRTI